MQSHQRFAEFWLPSQANRINVKLAIFLTVCSVFSSTASAQTGLNRSADTVSEESLPPIISSGNFKPKSLNQHNRLPTGELLLNRAGSNTSRSAQGTTPQVTPNQQPVLASPAQLEAQNPKLPELRTRPVSSNIAAESRGKTNSPTPAPGYHTASPYSLRAIDDGTEHSLRKELRATPVSSSKSVESTVSSDDLKASVPRVSRIPVPKTLKNSPESQDFPETRVSPNALPEVPSLAQPIFNSNTDSALGLDLPQAMPPLPEGEARLAPLVPSKLPEFTIDDQPQAPANSAAQLEVQLPEPPLANFQDSAGSAPNVAADNTDSAKSINPPNRLPPKLQGNLANSGLERLRMQTPRILVTLLGPPELAVGSAQQFRLVVRNEDKIPLTGLILRMDVPPGVDCQVQAASLGQPEVERAVDGTTMINWSFENLDGGREAVLPLLVTAKTAREFAVAMEWTLQPLAASTGIGVLTPQLELALEGPNEVNFAEPNVYRLQIKNRGNADAENVAVKLSAEHFGSSETQVGNIPAGGQKSIEVELVFNEPGNITISAEANATGNIAAASLVQVRVKQALLEATLEAPELVYHSTATQYLLRLRNRGDSTANSARIIVELPAECNVAALPPQATLQDGDLVYELKQLRPGQQVELPFNLSFAREGDNRVSVICSAGAAAPVRCTAVTTVKAVSDLKLLVTDPVAPAPVDGEVEYTLTLVNRGSKAAEQVTVVAMFSKDIEPTRAEGQRSQITAGQVRFQPITRVEPGQAVTLKVFAMASAAGTHRFRTEVRTSETEVKLVQEQSTEYLDSIRRTATSQSSSVLR